MDDLVDPDTPARQSSKLSLGSSPSVLSADEQLDDVDGPLTPTERIEDEDDLFGSAIHADSPEPPLSNSPSADEANDDDLQAEQFSASPLSSVPDNFSLSRSLSPEVEQSPPPPPSPKTRMKKRRRRRKGVDGGEEEEEGEGEETDGQKQNGDNHDTSDSKQGRQGRQENTKVQDKDTKSEVPEKGAKGRKRRATRPTVGGDTRTRRRLSRQDSSPHTDNSGTDAQRDPYEKPSRKNDSKPSRGKGVAKSNAGEGDEKDEEDGEDEQEQESAAPSSAPEAMTVKTTTTSTSTSTSEPTPESSTVPSTYNAPTTSTTITSTTTTSTATTTTITADTGNAEKMSVSLTENTAADAGDWDYQKKHKEALDALTHIEVEFARLRDKMYREKMAELNDEALMIANGTHPELAALMSEIEEKKARRIQSAEAWRKHQHANYRQQFEGFEYQANVHFVSKKNELRRDILATVNGKRWTMENERSKLNESSGSERLLSDGHALLRRKRIQKEESGELQDIKEAIGFPIAPKASGLSSRDIDEDMAALRPKVANP